jgi:adenylate cyclase
MRADRAFAFAGFVLDGRRGCLREGQRDIELRPKSFEVLKVLVQNPDRLVSKDELLSTVWPDVHVTEDSLTRCISDVRQALGDEEQRIIKTVPRRGYRFASPVRELSENGEPARSAARPDTGTPSPPAGLVGSGESDAPARAFHRHRPMLAGIAIFLVLIGAAAAWFHARPTGPAASDKPSIAVMSFLNMGASRDQEYFSDGVAEDLITGLSKFSDLFVIARDSSFAYKSRSVDLQQIGRDLGARYLVEGSVRRDGDRVRITVQLIEADTGKQIWAERYDRLLGDVFAIQDEVTRSIVRTLVAHITNKELDRALHKPPEALAAYESYLRGNAILKNRGGENRGQMVAEARRFYEQALALDPSYAPALQGLAYTYVTSWLEPMTYAPLQPEYRQKATLDRALSLAERAVERDPFSAEAYATLGQILHWQYRRAEGIAAFEHALELNPNLADGRFTFMLYQTGRPVEAIAFMKQVMRHEPFYPPIYLHYLGNAYYLTGDYQTAHDLLGDSSRKLPGFRPVFAWLAAAAAQLGDDREAHEAAAELMKIDPGFTISGFLNFIRLGRDEDVARLTAGLRKAGLPD